jgi:hypothetical protein
MFPAPMIPILMRTLPFSLKSSAQIGADAALAKWNYVVAPSLSP